MKQNKNLLKGIIGVVAMALIVVILFTVYNHFKPQTSAGAKKITVEVVIPEEETKDFTIQTDAEYLGTALTDENLVKGTPGDYGLFITEVNGRVADDTKQEWWCITKDGADVFTSADQTPVADGDKFEITLKTGY